MLIDANTYVGRWPFRRLSHAGASGLSELLTRTGTDLAIASPMTGGFYRDCLSAVEEMVEDPGWRQERMRPVAVVDPTFPGWRDDLATMVRDYNCVAVRVLPNYHSYRFIDDCAGDLLQAVQGHNLPLIVTMRMQDERSHHPRMLVESVPVDDVRYLLRQAPDLPIVLSNVTWYEVSALRPEMDLARQCVWEMSYKPPPYYIEKAAAEFGAERILYGSGAPLQYPESPLLTVRQAHVSDHDKDLILGGNATRTFGLRG